MNAEEIYKAWAPEGGKWSPWVIPAPFAELLTLETQALEPLAALASGLEALPDVAVVADLPGGSVILYGLALAQRGFRPLPVINGSPGPYSMHFSNDLPPSIPVAVDMREISRLLCAGALLLPALALPAGAPPVFLLDALRMSAAPGRGVFDNRWMAFPQDFPSAQALLREGIRRIVLVQRRAEQPREDLAHVLLRWEEAGLQIFAVAEGREHERVPMRINKPSRYRAVWYRMLALLGLQRNDAGGFGAWPPSGAG